MRKYKRATAKARMKACGVERINRKMSQRKDGVPLWRSFLFGEFAKQAERAQIRPKLKRKVRKLSGVSA